jgi:Domain of unknown function (DUF4253)
MVSKRPCSGDINPLCNDLVFSDYLCRYNTNVFVLGDEKVFNTIESISNLLQGSVLKGHKIRQLEIDGSDEYAFEIEIPHANAMEAWHLMRSHLKDTKRYPVLTCGWGSDDYFSRFYYQEEKNEGKLTGISPQEILASAPTADLENFLKTRRIARKEYLDDSIDYSLKVTKETFGACPDSAQIRELIDNGTIQSTVDLEKWLFDWELQHNKDVVITPNTNYLDWFEPDEKTAILMLLPTENGWDSLAYLHWYGACSAGTTVAISFLKRWSQQYKAELVCHYGTMLQLNVGRLPTTPEEAFELAWQQEALAECTTVLPGISLRDHARSLLTVNRWFLHERP